MVYFPFPSLFNPGQLILDSECGMLRKSLHASFVSAYLFSHFYTCGGIRHSERKLDSFKADDMWSCYDSLSKMMKEKKIDSILTSSTGCDTLSAVVKGTISIWSQKQLETTIATSQLYASPFSQVTVYMRQQQSFESQNQISNNCAAQLQAPLLFLSKGFEYCVITVWILRLWPKACFPEAKVK